MNPVDLQKLVTMAMPFGKHQEKLLADLLKPLRNPRP